MKVGCLYGTLASFEYEDMSERVYTDVSGDAHTLPVNPISYHNVHRSFFWLRQFRRYCVVAYH